MYIGILIGFLIGFVTFPAFMWVLDWLITGGEG